MSQQGLKAGPMQEGFLEYQDSKVHFHRFGNGEKLLIALHGFGDRASGFLALEPALKNDYTVYAINLPYHGQTQWQPDFFTQRNITDLFEMILNKEQKKRFELMGFSFGGRIILSTLAEVIDRLDKIYLIAPDGIRTKGLFNASIVPVWLKRLLQKWARQPEGLIAILEKCNKLGLLNNFNLNFLRNNLATAKRRDRLFNTWVSLAGFGVDPEKARALLKKYAIPVELYFGKYDKIIPPSAGEKLSKGIPNIRLNLLEDGHLLLNEKLNDLIGRQLRG